MGAVSWTPRVGDAIRRRNDPDAPRHTVMAVRGSGTSCTVVIDGSPNRWWDGDQFEPADPLPPPATASLDAQLNDALLGRMPEPEPTS